jgi:arylsulfatase B
MIKKAITIFAVILCSYYLSAQRNTILIIADDLSPDYFGFYENYVDTVDVPNIRALLAKGIRFKNLMSYPVCSPARASMLTGRYGFRTGVGNVVGTTTSNPIDTAEISIPKLLKIYNPNISKANIGKWHLNPPNPASNLLSPLALGYNRYEGSFSGQLTSFTNWTKYTNGVASTITTYATTENVNNTISWLKSQSPTAPFFVWLAFNAPHEPLHLPPANLHNFTGLSGTTANINAQPKTYFKAMIQAMDHEIGRLFDSLQVMNKLDSTDIIFIGDNGNTRRTAQIADLSKAKGTIYQYGVNVPMIIAGPSVVNKGRVSNALVNIADLFATIVENFGYTNWVSQIPVNKPVDSKSLQPIIKNLTDSIRPWSFTELFTLTPDSSDGKAIRNKNYKLIKFNYGKEEFYNLSTDPIESINLLTGTLSATDITNYYYLCNELTTLLNSGSFCNTSIGIKEIDKTETMQVFPNPFYNKITIQPSDKNYFIELMNSFGQKVYTGQIIEQQDFQSLPQGLYLLNINHGQKIMKLLKQ